MCDIICSHISALAEGRGTAVLWVAGSKKYLWGGLKVDATVPFLKDPGLDQRAPAYHDSTAPALI